MCGIIGAVSQRNSVPVLLNGLQRLEYRGYDSAGIAVLMPMSQGHVLERVRSLGRVAALQRQTQQLESTIGIAHTRWATHGGVTENNAHPHISHGELAVVHNGVIENYETHRLKLQAQGYHFESQTDTEVIGHLIHQQLQQHHDLSLAVLAVCRQLCGAYAIAVIWRQQPDRLVAARCGCPLIIGVGRDEYFVASDVAALLNVTREMIYLQDGDVAALRCQELQIYDAHGTPLQRPSQHSTLREDAVELGAYQHFMHKEIHEQPQALTDTLVDLVEHNFAASLFGERASSAFECVTSVLIVACGSSYYAGLVAQYWIEAFTLLPCRVETASEYRYRRSIAHPRQLVVAISQSGETLDTLEAVKHAQTLGHSCTLALCNVVDSSLARLCPMVFYTHAGPEIGVASTKAFTTQLLALFGLCLSLGESHGAIHPRNLPIYAEQIRQLPQQVQQCLNVEAQIQRWAERLQHKQHVLFLGRGSYYPIALEGALKLKETAYIHAEAYPGGELKHGPLALVDEAMPVVVLAPKDTLLEKMKANIQEVHARGAELFIFTDQESGFQAADRLNIIYLPPLLGALSPIVYTVAVQLLAYHTARCCGTDIDKPRNLAKSVTVE